MRPYIVSHMMMSVDGHINLHRAMDIIGEEFGIQTLYLSAATS